MYLRTNLNRTDLIKGLLRSSHSSHCWRRPSHLPSSLRRSKADNQIIRNALHKVGSLPEVPTGGG